MAGRRLRFSAEMSCWNWEPDHGYELTRELLKQTRPRALLCLNDRLAFGAYQALGEAGLAIPSDVALVSFDNDELASYLRPGLTTIALPHETMGRTAVELLLDQGGGTSKLIPMPVVLRGSLPPV